jgi:peptide/nickel transport system permease protein
VTLRGFLLRRLSLGVLQITGAVTLIFALTEALPGDAAVALAGDRPDPAEIERIREALGLDQPAWVRFGDWLAGLVQGDLGTSLVADRPVASFLAEGLPPSLLLAALSVLLIVPVSVLLGVAAAVREGGYLDRALSTVTLALYAVPEFAFALLLVVVFAIQLRWLPPTAVGGGELLGQPAVLILPVVVLVARPICGLSRLIRAGMIEALKSSYVRHARRLGLSRSRVLLAHALPNAAAPAVQHFARTVDWLLGGVIVVEAIFVIPGLGSTLTESIAARDLPVIQGLAVLFAATTVLVNLAADVVEQRLVPRTEVIR